MKLKLYQILSYLNSGAWALLGGITLGGIFISADGIFVNITVGLLFLLLAFYFYSRSKALIALFSCIPNEPLAKKSELVLKHEKVMLGIQLFIGLVMLSGVISRVFGEGVPVFG